MNSITHSTPKILNDNEITITQNSTINNNLQSISSPIENISIELLNSVDYNDSTDDSTAQEHLLESETSNETLLSASPDPVDSQSQSQIGAVTIDNLQIPTLESSLTEWVLNCRPNVSHVDKLLKVLNKFPLGENLPKTYETLMGTARNLVFRDVAPGQYFHVGIRRSITRALNYYAPVSIQNSTIEMDVNIDGLPIYNTSTAQFWPILGHIKNIPHSNPFVIGIYFGYEKPYSADEFLEDFINEMLSIGADGIHINYSILKLKIRAIICDMPAKAFVKLIKNHNAYYSCTICIQSGEYVNGRMCFPEMDASERTDSSFRNRVHEEHHINDGESISPFERLPYIDMIKSFPLDYMHLLLLGVTKKLLTQWRSGSLSVRMSGTIQAEVSRRLLNVRTNQSRHFSRRSRALEDLANWRSTEFRTFLLYTGPVILKNVIPPLLYNNFLYLHVATKLCVKGEYTKYLNIAQRLYREFIETFRESYGVELISSNVHSVIHIVECVRHFGILDSFSAFPHEATLGKIKNLVEKRTQELQQVAKRLLENDGLMIRSKIPIEKQLSLRMYPYTDNRYQKLEHLNNTYYNDDEDGWILTNDLNIFNIQYFTTQNSDVFLHGEEKCKPYMNIYDLPIESSKLLMFKVSDNNKTEEKILSINDIKCKIFLFNMPDDEFHSYYMAM